MFHIHFWILFISLVKLTFEETPAYPTFPRKAQFLIENIAVDDQQQRNYFQCIYDYELNRLILETDRSIEFYDYGRLKKSIYTKDSLQRCVVYPIDHDDRFDGFSAITNPLDNQTYIRTLEDFLLLMSNSSFLKQTTIRGTIQVNQWVNSFDNETEIIWSIARPTYRMPWTDTEYSTPIQRLIRRKDDGTVLFVMNIFQYKTIITQTDLSPPQGIYCNGLVDSEELLSLQDFGIVFPETFSVRIDVSTVARQLWQTVHIRSIKSNSTRMLRFDYKPSDNIQNPKTVILDLTNGFERAYRIDERTGFCLINQSTEIFTAPSIVHDPIETLIKYNQFLLFNPPHRVFQYVGQRPCRGSIVCSIFIAQLSEFTTDFDDQWVQVSLEWAWSKRNPDNPESSYDYPVYIHINLYRDFDRTPPATVHYEFYDYNDNVKFNQFDISLCYRSNQLRYQHLAFQMKIDNKLTPEALENGFIDRRALHEQIRSELSKTMGIRNLRISQLELDHQSAKFGHNDSLYCIFTLLDRLSFPSASSEIDLDNARQRFEAFINSGRFQIPISMGISLNGEPYSLETVANFYRFNPNATVNQTEIFFNTTIHLNRTFIETIQEFYETFEYSDGAQAGAIVGGTVVGAISGTLMVILAVHSIKKKANKSPTGGLTFRNISFRLNKNSNQGEIGMVPMSDQNEQTTNVDS